VPVGLPADLLERRPDLASAAARIRAADRRADAARAALLPALRLTGSAGRTSDEVGDLLDGDFDIWSLGAGLTQPLFQGGRLRAAADRDEARVVEALAVYEGAVLAALGEVETALASEDALAEYEAGLAVAEDTARGAAELALDEYVSGRATVLEVLDAQRAHLDARAQRLTARRRLLDARIDLHLALGGGFGTPAD
jgi:outer membrane protein TolC